MVHSFKPVWKPPFISTLAPEDRCPLDGLAMKEGMPRYATAASAAMLSMAGASAVMKAAS